MDRKSSKTTNILLAIIATILFLFTISALVVVSRNDNGYGSAKFDGRCNLEKMNKQNCPGLQNQQATPEPVVENTTPPAQ